MPGADFNSLFTPAAPSAAPTTFATDVSHNGMADALGTYDDEELLELWQKIRKECIDSRLVFERQWHRNILYFLNRQWIEYSAGGNNGGWRDKRLAAWVPRPVTNKCRDTVDSIRAIFTAVQLGVSVRPNGNDPKNVAAASTADDLAPIIHDVHHMNQVLMEFDFWLLVCGNAFLYTFVDYDLKYGTVQDPSNVCGACGATANDSDLVEAGDACPTCGAPANQFTPLTDDDGNPVLNERPKGQPVTIPLSPLEVAMSNSYQRFEDLPYVVRLRWRTKSYYEGHPELKDLVPQISWEKGSGDLSLQLFRSLTQHNDLGLAPQYLMGSELSGSDREDGITEYEIHYKPCDAYPQGLVFRVIGDKEGGHILHLPQEALPGPLPYKDVNGKPLFTFAHAAYEHVGGRILGAGPLDIMIQKQDQLNQLDSMMLLHLNRMANPVWIIPKGAGIGKLNGMPGLVVEWDSLTLGGQGKPERIAGVDLAMGYFTLRQQYLNDIEELTGTYDIMKGAKPANVDAFSALQFLDERAKGRFTPVFQARADAYAAWFKSAIELEREFGPDTRTMGVMSNAHGWTFKNFKRADLQGDISVVVENGSTAPKTNLGLRAALDHAVQMKFINPEDPDQQYAALQLMGLTRMVPAIDIDTQSALQKQDAFEQWAANKAAMAKSFAQAQEAMLQYQLQVTQQLTQHATQVSRVAPNVSAPLPPLPPTPPPPSILQFTPLVWRPWYNPIIHKREFLKWANSDSIRQLVEAAPQLVPLLAQHQQEIQQAMPPAVAEPPKTQFNFGGQDLADPQVRSLFDRSEGLPPGDPSMTPPRPGTVANPRVGITEKPTPPTPPNPAGAGAAMRNSNRESTQGVEPPLHAVT
jgi:hypothetical protein